MQGVIDDFTKVFGSKIASSSLAIVLQEIEPKFFTNDIIEGLIAGVQTDDEGKVDLRAFLTSIFIDDTSAPHARLIFSRHGESEWNVANKFTGWVDVNLSAKGVEEAKGAGKLLKEEGIKLDVCFTSYLKRAIRTCDLALETAGQLHVPVNKTWRLNERMYGGLQGLDKKETVQKHGPEQVQIWRRSFDLPPPEIDTSSEYYTGGEAKYKQLSKEQIPTTESLKDVIARVMPYWTETIEPELKAGKTVFVAAHGNSIRAIVKAMEGISDEVIPGLEIPTATPLVYDLNADLKPIPTDMAMRPLKFGRYLGDAEKIRAAAEAVKNQTKVASKNGKLIFSRHGESEWNVANRFTGWVDVNLSEKGVEEAKGAGKLLKEEGIKVDICFTSYLKRAIKTCDLALESACQLHVPVKKTWRLNERMYGGLQGLDKKETVVKHGPEQVQIWRRSFDLPPPEIEGDSEYYTGSEAKYKDVPKEQIPKTESLKDVIARVMPYWTETIEPELKAGKTVFVAAHGNSIRAIVKALEGITDEEIPGLEIPTATPLVYEITPDLKPVANDLAVKPLMYGRYLGDAEKIRAAAEAVKNQTKV